MPVDATAAPGEPLCPICAARAWSIMLRGVRDYISDERFDIASCQNCGMAITVPMPGDDVIERYYSARYRGDRHAFTDQMRVSLRARAVTARFPRRFTGRILDIGCGDGQFAIKLRDAGWQVSVTEINSIFLDRLRASGIEAKTPQQALQDEFGHPFDAVTCWHVLEHVLRPAELVRWVRRILAPGGIFQVTVPTLSSWQAALCGRNWLHLDVPRHRYHFDNHTLRRILEQNGFEIVDSTTFAFEYDWFGAIQSALNALCSRRNVLFEKLTSQSRSWPASNSDGSRTAADWVDIAISCLLAPPIALATLPACLVSWLFGRGATLTITARAASQPK